MRRGEGEQSHEQAPAPSPSGRPGSRPYELVLLFNAMFGGLTAVGLPLALNSAGLSKAAIAVFFVSNAFVAVFYNTVLVPRIRRAGYPRLALIGTLCCVPVGTLLVARSADQPEVLYTGGVLMLCVSAVVPQIFGRAGTALGGEITTTMVLRFRRVLIAGYIAGLLLYSVCVALHLDPLLVAALVASLCLTGPVSSVFRGKVAPSPRALGEATRSPLRRPPALVVCAALVVVALLKSVDTLRGLYLPLVAASGGIEPSLISASFMVGSLLEFAMLPILGMLMRRQGSALASVVVASVSIAVFVLMASSTGIWALFIVQALYSFVGAGFQSVGLLLLSDVRGSDAGAGASAYMAVTQVGTVLGALLPLVVPGYSPAIFWLAAAMSFGAAALGWVVHSRSGASRSVFGSVS